MSAFERNYPILAHPAKDCGKHARVSDTIGKHAVAQCVGEGGREGGEGRCKNNYLSFACGAWERVDARIHQLVQILQKRVQGDAAEYSGDGAQLVFRRSWQPN